MLQVSVTIYPGHNVPGSVRRPLWNTLNRLQPAHIVHSMAQNNCRTGYTKVLAVVAQPTYIAASQYSCVTWLGHAESAILFVPIKFSCGYMWHILTLLSDMSEKSTFCSMTIATGYVASILSRMQNLTWCHSLISYWKNYEMILS